jgi:hypothetical protein
VVEGDIARQRKHHRKETSSAELLRLLRAREVEYDERYVLE